MRDAIIIGAGPVGLALAASLGRQGRTVALIERQQATQLAEPLFDGRDIALTRRSRDILMQLGAWQWLPADETYPLCSARVRNGGSTRTMALNPPAMRDRLGDLVPNFRIRAALYRVMQTQPEVEFFAGETVTAACDEGHAGVAVDLASGGTLRAHVLIAADSRLSAMRDLFGIGADVRHLGKTMLVFRILHDAPHEGVATEWFAQGLTIALLPLEPGMSSVVMTLPHGEAKRLLNFSDAELSDIVRRQFGSQLGAVRVASSRHAYPLIVTYADRFASGRVALVGDAALGMHPVTAHGFNFGLKGQERLARRLTSVLSGGQPFAIEGALQRYAFEHRRETRPLYVATNSLTRLFTAEGFAPRALRHAILAAGTRLLPARAALTAALR